MGTPRRAAPRASSDRASIGATNVVTRAHGLRRLRSRGRGARAPTPRRPDTLSTGTNSSLARCLLQGSRMHDADGAIDADEFQLALFGREVNGGKTRDLFSERIFACFDSARDGQLTFEEFVKGLSVFH